MAHGRLAFVQLAAGRLEGAQVGGQGRGGLVVEPHFGVDQLADVGQRGRQELVGELYGCVGPVFLAADVDLLEDLLPEEVLEAQFAVALGY